jgi:hypothetical protein
LEIENQPLAVGDNFITNVLSVNFRDSQSAQSRFSGTDQSSPPFQRRVDGKEHAKSPQGTAEVSYNAAHVAPI